MQRAAGNPGLAGYEELAVDILRIAGLVVVAAVVLGNCFDYCMVVDRMVVVDYTVEVEDFADTAVVEVQVDREAATPDCSVDPGMVDRDDASSWVCRSV